MIYVAAPYNHLDSSVVQLRIEQLYEYLGILMMDGNHATSPLFMHEIVTRFKDIPTSYTYWETYCLHTLNLCDEMYVLKLPGWESSKGVRAEIDFCERNLIPITYVDFGEIS